MIFGLVPYHVGICVADLDGEWMAVGERLGIDLAPPVEGACPLRTADGIMSLVTMRSAWSRGGYPALEVTQAVPGTIWTAGHGIHHFGVWADDLDALSGRLDAGGAQRELEGDVDGEVQFRYYLLPGGARVELVSTAMKPYMDDLIGVTT